MIWCVEDEAGIRDMELYTLQHTGFACRGFREGGELWEALREETPSLILLDVMLPGEDGIAILKKLKSSESTRKIPVIMATAKGMEYDKVHSLDLGADDYMVKPFGMMEMVSRIKAVLRRFEDHSVQHLLRAEGLVVNLDEHTVTADAQRIPLTFKEYELLRIFLSNPGLAFTRDQLFDEVWGTGYMGESRTVDMHIRTLRQKLGRYGSLIETIRGVGYRLEVQK